MAERVKVDIRGHLSKLGVKKLKREQKDIVNAILGGRDVLGVLPTGFGKSLLYVLPHLITQKNVIVVSPLISLIRDQEQKFSKICKTFVMTGSRVSFNGVDGVDVSHKIASREVNALIFMTPETLLNRRAWLTSLDILAIAIDECHCITEWANFRPSYAELKCVISWFRKRPAMLAVTATATEDTEKSLIAFFKLKEPLRLRISAVRDDLELNVEEKGGLAADLRYISKIAEGKTIIYCKTKKETEKMSCRLGNMCDGGVDFYHAGRDTEDRSRVQDDFAMGACRVVVATIAFGMGIDIPDITTIIHYGLPKDLDSYCQEIGRAARSQNVTGRCFLLWGKRDFVINTQFTNKLQDPQEKSYQQKKSRALSAFVNNASACRMFSLAKYFDPTVESTMCGKCDVCNSRILVANPSLRVPTRFARH